MYAEESGDIVKAIGKIKGKLQHSNIELINNAHSLIMGDASRKDLLSSSNISIQLGSKTERGKDGILAIQN